MRLAGCPVAANQLEEGFPHLDQCVAQEPALRCDHLDRFVETFGQMLTAAAVVIKSELREIARRSRLDQALQRFPVIACELFQLANLNTVELADHTEQTAEILHRLLGGNVLSNDDFLFHQLRAIRHCRVRWSRAGRQSPNVVLELLEVTAHRIGRH